MVYWGVLIPILLILEFSRNTLGKFVITFIYSIYHKYFLVLIKNIIQFNVKCLR